MRRGVPALLLGLALSLVSAPAPAEDIVLMMSTQDVTITSTYTGARVALFGSIERNAGTIARAGKYEIAVTVSGPAGPVVVRGKEKVGPAWINRNLRRYVGVPGFFAVLSTSAIDTAANEEARQRQKLGLEYYLPALDRSSENLGEDAEPRDALLRLRKASELYVQDPRGVTMPRPNLFSSIIPLPAAAPTGRYIVAVTLFSEGVPLASSNTSFIVRKIGFEAFVAQSARDRGVLYGLVAAAIAIFLGVLGNLAFRRD